ncbi:MAG: hypothetical protein AMXMBFR58_24050 [Phycisphaerae bacterium]
MPDETRSNAPWLRAVSEAAAVIVRDGVEIRARIADLTIRTYRSRGMSLDGLGELVEAVLRGVVAGLEGKSPQARDRHLREVFEGLADTYAAVAQPQRAADNWADLQRRFSAAISDLATRAGADIMADFRRVADQISESSRILRPKAKAAVDAFEREVVEPAADVAAQGAQKVRHRLGVLLAAAGELLHDFGESVRQGHAQRPASEEASASGSAPRSTTSSRTEAIPPAPVVPAARPGKPPKPSASPASRPRSAKTQAKPAANPRRSASRPAKPARASAPRRKPTR